MRQPAKGWRLLSVRAATLLLVVLICGGGVVLAVIRWPDPWPSDSFIFQVAETSESEMVLPSLYPSGIVVVITTFEVASRRALLTVGANVPLLGG